MKKPSAVSRIASQFSDPRNVSKAVEERKARRRAQEAFEAPANPTEETVSAIWSKLLAVDKVGRTDNFFALGGHSLLATQMLARVRDNYGVELPLKALFESPVLASFAQKIDSSRNSSAPIERPTPRLRAGPLPLSYAQQRLWFIDQLEPGSALYNVPRMYRLQGALKVEALERALHEIVRRHEILRTTYQVENDQPVQVIASELTVPLPLIDLSSLPVAIRENESRRIVEQEAGKTFNLAEGPMLRALLVRLGAGDHILVLSTHHIASDGWSGGVIIRDLAAFYQAALEGKPASLPELTIQYADYVVWQREWLQGEVLEQGVAYWREHLAGAPAVLELPTDRPRPAVQRHRGAMRTHVLPRPLVDRLRSLSQAEGATLYMTLLAGFQLLLSRYSGQEDIVVGSTVAGRNYAEVEPLIGYFANTLALRSDLSGDPTFRELLARVKKVALDAYAHQEIPFEKLVEELQPQRSLSYNPIFQVLFGLQNLPRQAFELSSLRVERMSVHPETSIFDMSWFAFETADGLLLRVEYDTDLYEDATIARALGHYEKLLEGIAARPESALSGLELLTAAEQSRILVDWNATQADYPRELCLHQLFEQQAERTPHAVACVFENDQLSYGELNQRANQLAHYLRRRGAGPGQRVGVFLERSLDMMVALLGVQKTGAAYVPLDPAYPAERLRLILEQAQVPVLVTESSLLESLPPHDSEIICLDRDSHHIQQQPRSNPPREGGPEDLIYVIFTSGSTGRPKGVQVPHRAVVNLLWCMTRQLQMGPEDVFPALASFAFDMCIPELYLPLVSGGRVAIGGRRLAGDGEELARFLRRHGATVVHATPTTWDLLLEAGFTGHGLKRVIGAEALPQDLCDRLLEADASLYNYYGPTETTVWSTMHHFRTMDEPVVVGRPLANTQVYILDRRLRIVPIGVPGEIFIGGDGVTHGYLNESELTAEKFLEDPFARSPGRKMYRTGDLGRFLADGRIEFWGRADRQVKIRGFRIELGEVEAALGQHPAVREAVVVAREDVPGDKRLVGYVVTVDQQAVPAAELRGFVKQKLPEYMVPVAWVQMERFPLSANGKVDRGNLPAPEYRRQDQEHEYVAPRTPAEEVIGSIWAEVLKLDRVGVEDNFFQLGGHSLLGTQVVSRIRQRFGVELPLRGLFEAPTVAGLAERITVCQREQQGVRTVPLQRVKRTGRPLPLSYAQQRLWFIDQLEPGSPLYNLPQMYRMQGALKVEALERALHEIVRRHEVLRTTFPGLDGQPVQVIAEELRLPLRRVVVEGAGPPERQAEARRLARQEALQPFDLGRGPLLRATLLRVEEDEHVLLLTLHHIVSDGWSGNLLAAEMAALYEAFAQDRSSPLPELAIQYADYVVWQREWLQGEVLEQGVAYWREHLAGAPAVLELPTDRPRPAVQRHRGAMRTHVLPRPLVDRLRSLSQAEGATLYMTLLAGFQLLLSRYSGQEDIVVGSTVAGRNYAEVEPLIGYFANTLALRSDLSGDPTFRELLARVKKVALDAYAHQEIPFEKLVEELQPQRSLSYNPIFQVLFGLQNLPRQAFELSSLRVERMSVHPETSIFDMSWFAFETADGLLLRVEYDTDLYEDATIARALGHYEKLLEGIAARPESALSGLELLTAAEQSRILVDWNATQADYPRELCLHQLFEQQAERTPHAVACVFENDQLSYGELNQRANQLAHYLRRRGAGPGQRVGVFLERSLDMMVALLGVQKTGAAYVPLDPAYPAERLRLILEQAQVPVLVTESSLLESLPPHDSEIICLDRDSHHIQQQPRSNPPREGGPEDLIYVIFTSGSTGRPKGVQVPHRAVVNLLWCMTRQLQMGPEDVFPALASFAFDMCIPELYLPLVSGGRVAIGGRRLAGDGEELARFLRRHGATVVHATPTTWDLLLEAGFTGHGLKRVIGAEALPQDLCDRLLEADASLYNYYGPTETTVWSTMHHFRTMDEPVVVGRPLANTQVYILDRRLRIVPIGVPGEIFIGGDGVTHGYLNESELTAEKFLEDPFARSPGRKMYRTGDLGRFLADGRIEFWGRADRQVKIRGFRIELGEVEAALGQHPAVREAVVVAREDVPGDKRLVGYVVTVDQQAVPAAELRGFVKQKLPEYMVPVAWVQMERFPLSANGKVDRGNLPAPEYRRQDQEHEYVAPRTPAEEVISSIWAEVLKLDRVGVEDNFFQLGGHSLLGTQVVSRIRQRFGVELPLRGLFEAPTVAGLAERITVCQREQQGVRTVPLQRVKRTGRPLPLSYAQQRLWFIDQLEPGSPLYNLPRPIRMSGALKVDALEKALNDLVQRHEILRSTYSVENDQPVQVIASQLTIPLPLIDLSGLPASIRDNQARRIVEEEAWKTFNLAEGPMLRALLVRLGTGDHILVLSTHHIASDGWSGGVLIRDLAVFYQAALEGKPASLPELTIQYADYAVWQRNWLQGKVLENRLTYWRSRLEGAPPILTLPTDRPRPPVQTFRGAAERSVLPKTLADDVLALSRQQGATTFMTLLAAFQSLLFYFSHEPDMVLGTDIANRTTVQTENLIGFFVNLLVLRTNLSGDPSFEELLDRVREVALGAYAHQEIPFDKLVEELQPQRSLSYNPLVQALFVEFNLPRGGFQMPGLELSWFKLQLPSKFDLAVFVSEGEKGTGTTWLYNPDLFDPSTVLRMMHLYQISLETVILDPAIRLSALLQRLSEAEQRWRAAEHKEFEEVSLQKLKKIKRRAAKEMSP